MAISLKKIMIIEDDLDLAKSLSEFLSIKGYDIYYLEVFAWLKSLRTLEI
ncbi:MAG TPA: response regulator transcription factor [Clostridiaceae bacterium]|nr:response regulator transcription factor [Clostridiaceae bacterium]